MKQHPSDELKCLVWDLDNTLWTGTFSEGDAITLNPEALKLIQTLDQRGILQSIASKNDGIQAWELLKDFQIDHFFLCPKINWNSKSTSIKLIATQLNIGLDSIGFIDDQAFERKEVIYHLPMVKTYPTSQLSKLANLPEFNPETISSEAHNRRKMYQQDHIRQHAESTFEGTNEQFLESLEMQLKLSLATEPDLERLKELSLRTNQLNTTGLTFSQQQLRELMIDPEHELWVVQLEDKIGSYGSIGMVLLQKHNTEWNIRLFLLSCRVMARGIGSALISYIKNLAFRAHVNLYADFKETDRNRMMYLTYKFAGFGENPSSHPNQKLCCKLDSLSPLPSYISLQSDLEDE